MSTVLDVSLESIVGLRSSDDECEDFDDECYEIAVGGACLECYRMDPSKGVCPFLGAK